VNIASWIKQRALLEPTAEIVKEGTHAFNNRDFYHRVLSASSFLRSQGVGSGDRVSVMLYNSSLFLELLFGCARIGAIMVPLNYRLVGAELSYMIEHSESAILISDPDFREGLEGLKPGPKCLLFPDREEDGFLHLPPKSKDPDNESPPLEAEAGDETPLLIMYTSGTTGRPKGATLSHGNVLWNAIMHLNEGLYRERALVNAPLFHVGGLNAIATAILYGKGSLVVQRSFDPHQTLELIEREKITCMFGAPAMLEMMVRDPLFDKTDFSSVRYLQTGASPAPPALLEKYHTKGIKIRQGYGLTEASPAACLLQDEFAMVKPGSCGKEFFHLEIRIVDNNGADVKQGDVGELIIRGPNVMLGYWRDPESTRETLRNGWLYTGDLARKDEDGFIYIVDRKKDMLISGGENVYPAEVELALFQHEAIAETAVIGVPDDKWGEVPAAFVVLEKGTVKPTPDDLIQFCRSRIAKYKIPKHFHFVEELPRTPVGKVNKIALKEGWAGRLTIDY